MIFGTPPIVTNGLVLHLDAGSRMSYPGSGTTWSDLSGNRNSGSLTNGPIFDSTNQGSVVLDGTNDYITTPYLPSGTNPFTYNVWFYLTQNISGSFDTIKAGVLFSGNATGTSEILLLTNTSTPAPPNNLNFGRYGGGTTGTCSVSVTGLIGIQLWNNISLTHTGTSQAIYLNGRLIGTGNVSNSFTAGTSWIGGAPINSLYAGYLAARIGQVQLYNRALSAQEVTQNYNALKNRFGLT